MKLLRAGRRAGKSKFGIKWILDGLCVPNTKNWIVAPTARQGKDIFWFDLFNILSEAKAIKNKNANLCDLTLKNGAQLGIRGTNVEDNLRGNGLDRLFFDEFAYSKPLVWEKILRPQLIDRKGHVIFSSSPKGKNHFKKMEEYIRAQMVKHPKDYYFKHATIYDNPHLDKEYIDKERSQNTDDVWRQEYLAEYIDWIGSIYHEFDFDANSKRAQVLPVLKDFPYVKAMDWGLDDDTACVWCHAKDNVVYVRRYYHKSNTNPHAHVRAIESLDDVPSGESYNVLDKSAWRRESNGVSVAQQFAQSGMRPLYPSRGDLDYSINIVKRMMANGQLVIGNECHELITDLVGWEYGAHEPDGCAAMRYACVFLVEKGIIKLLDGPTAKHRPPTNAPIAALPAGKVARVRLPKEDMSWNYEDGCAE
jgi:phage terminase large subunit